MTFLTVSGRRWLDLAFKQSPPNASGLRVLAASYDHKNFNIHRADDCVTNQSNRKAPNINTLHTRTHPHTHTHTRAPLWSKPTTPDTGNSEAPGAQLLFDGREDDSPVLADEEGLRRAPARVPSAERLRCFTPFDCGIWGCCCREQSQNMLRLGAVTGIRC